MSRLVGGPAPYSKAWTWGDSRRGTDGWWAGPQATPGKKCSIEFLFFSLSLPHRFPLAEGVKWTETFLILLITLIQLEYKGQIDRSGGKKVSYEDSSV